MTPTFRSHSSLAQLGPRCLVGQEHAQSYQRYIGVSDVLKKCGLASHPTPSLSMMLQESQVLEGLLSVGG